MDPSSLPRRPSPLRQALSPSTPLLRRGGIPTVASIAPCRSDRRTGVPRSPATAPFFTGSGFSSRSATSSVADLGDPGADPGREMLRSRAAIYDGDATVGGLRQAGSDGQ